MKILNSRVLMLTAALFGLAGCAERSVDPAVGSAPSAPLPVQGPAPVWALQDIHGQAVSSADFAGKVVVVDFWATWCAPCLEEIPGYIDLQRKYADQGLVILGLSLDAQGPPVVKRFAERVGINYPLLMADGDVAEAFGGVQAIPTTFVIDRAGQVRHKKVGLMPTAQYEQILVQLLNERG